MPGFWSDRTVLVTGGSGFLGAAVCAKLRERGVGRLVATGFCTWGELDGVIMAEYERGVVRFHAGRGQATELRMRDVLDVALDANALLRLARLRGDRIRRLRAAA